ncbi:MAG: aldehyde dehydrogenase family protein [Pseudomonadota bacterium]
MSDIENLMARARAAQATFANATQAQTDLAVQAIAWSIYQPDRARELAELAVADTKIGNVASKIVKNQRKTFGTLRDLLRVKSVGIIEESPDTGIIKYAKPVGIVGAVSPSTNPAATPINKAMFAIKGRNAIIIAASPAGYITTEKTVDYMRAALEKIGANPDLVQILPPPVSKETTQALMEAVDLVVVTGSQNNVRRAYSSGTPAIGVGAGNVPVIIDSSADLDDAAQKICASKCFDNATSCSSENSVTIVGEVYASALQALQNVGGYLCDAQERQQIIGCLWENGKLNRNVIARDADVLAKAAGLGEKAQNAKFFMVEDGLQAGVDFPLSGEKLSLVLTVYRADTLQDALRHCQAILDFSGPGHSIGIHTHTQGVPEMIAERVNVVRVLVNQAHTFGNGGSFDNGLNFTLTMGCGTWAGNSIAENLNWRNFINVTHLVRTIPQDKPSEEALFGSYWQEFGKE